MDLKYLQSELLPQRRHEIENGQNAATRQPIYVVLDMQENIVSGHSDYSPITNYRGWMPAFGYIDGDADSEDVKFKASDEDMENPIEVTRFYTERIIAFFFTKKEADRYLQYQKHNLTNGYVFVFYSGYGNYEMDRLLCGE